MNRFIWLIGENLGETTNNNSFHFWKQIAEYDDNIDKYYILNKTPKNQKIYSEMNPSLRKWIIWKNSLKHFQLYFKADMFFVTLSYRDVRPEKLAWKKLNFPTTTPIIYLQHGTLAIKKIGYNGKSYNNNLFRFLYYNPHIKENIINQNNFKDYQLYYGEYPPRYIELVKRAEKPHEKKKILWFLTWREYLGKNHSTKILLRIIHRVLTDPLLIHYLNENDYELNVCCHSFFKDTLSEITEELNSPNIYFTHASKIDIMAELANSDVLITDYSSVGFDFTFLNKPVVLFQPDLEKYLKERELYCSIEELVMYSISTPHQLVDTIIHERYSINPFFRQRLPENINYEYVKLGKHIDRIYEEFKKIQYHKITFIGYNFFGIGGTVLATRALAEGLLERGYLVQLLSLRQAQTPHNLPYGLNMKRFYDIREKSKTARIKKLCFRRKKFYSYLIHDKSLPQISAYSGYALTKWMQNTTSDTVISTRESMHLFLYNAQSENIRNKIYFFHCPTTIFDDIFPGLMDSLKKVVLEKAIFVTENNRKQLFDKYAYDKYASFEVLGNGVESSRCVENDELTAVPAKDVYYGIYLVRISEERREDIINLLNYGRYLKERNETRIVIDIYGTGNMLDEFFDILIEEDLKNYIHYRGVTNNIKLTISQYDAVVDFSLNHSFGMPYIEGILNGKMVFCMRNEGSLEVMNQIPYAYINSFDDLTYKLLHLPDMTVEELRNYYNIIYNKYSRYAVADKFISILE